jgi:hypothetical protein
VRQIQTLTARGPQGAAAILQPDPYPSHPAMFIAKGAFCDFKTMEQLLALKLSNKQETFLPSWEPHMLDHLPIYQWKDGKVESASTFSTRFHSLARRAGYACPLTIHNFRAEVLFLIGKPLVLFAQFSFANPTK